MLPVSNTCGRIFHCEAGQEPATSPEALHKTHRAENACTEAAERESWSGRACPGWIRPDRRQKEKCDTKVLREPCFSPKLRGRLRVLQSPFAAAGSGSGRAGCAARCWHTRTAPAPPGALTLRLLRGATPPFHSCRVRLTFKTKTAKSLLKSFQLCSVTVLMSKDSQHRSQSYTTLQGEPLWARLHRSSSQSTPALFLTQANAGEQAKSRRRG